MYRTLGCDFNQAFVPAGTNHAAEHKSRRAKKSHKKSRKHRRRSPSTSSSSSSGSSSQQEKNAPKLVPAPVVEQGFYRDQSSIYLNRKLVYPNGGNASMALGSQANPLVQGRTVDQLTLGPAGPGIPQNPLGFEIGNGSKLYASGHPNNGMPSPFVDGFSAGPGDFAGTFMDPNTGIIYASYTDAMQEPVVQMERPVIALGTPNRALEFMTGVPAIAIPTPREHETTWESIAEGVRFPATEYSEAAIQRQREMAAAETFFVNNEVEAGFNDTHWDGYIGDTFVLRTVYDTQTLQENSQTNTTENNHFQTPDYWRSFSLGDGIGNHIGDPMQPGILILAEDKPGLPGISKMDFGDSGFGNTILPSVQDGIKRMELDGPAHVSSYAQNDFSRAPNAFQERVVDNTTFVSHPQGQTVGFGYGTNVGMAIGTDGRVRGDHGGELYVDGSASPYFQASGQLQSWDDADRGRDGGVLESHTGSYAESYGVPGQGVQTVQDGGDGRNNELMDNHVGFETQYVGVGNMQTRGEGDSGKDGSFTMASGGMTNPAAYEWRAAPGVTEGGRYSDANFSSRIDEYVTHQGDQGRFAIEDGGSRGDVVFDGHASTAFQNVQRGMPAPYTETARGRDSNVSVMPPTLASFSVAETPFTRQAAADGFVKDTQLQSAPASAQYIPVGSVRMDGVADTAHARDVWVTTESRPFQSPTEIDRQQVPSQSEDPGRRMDVVSQVPLNAVYVAPMGLQNMPGRVENPGKRMDAFHEDSVRVGDTSVQTRLPSQTENPGRRIDAVFENANAGVDINMVARAYSSLADGGRQGFEQVSATQAGNGNIYAPNAVAWYHPGIAEGDRFRDPGVVQQFGGQEVANYGNYGLASTADGGHARDSDLVTTFTGAVENDYGRAPVMVSDSIQTAKVGEFAGDVMRVSNDRVISGLSLGQGHFDHVVRDAKSVGDVNDFIHRHTRTGDLYRQENSLAHKSTFGLGAEYRASYAKTTCDRPGFIVQNPDMLRMATDPTRQLLERNAADQIMKSKLANMQPDSSMLAQQTAYESDVC